jgi:hypothetical protein
MSTAYAAHNLQFNTGEAVNLKAAALVAADTNETGVYLGHGAYVANVVWTALEIGSGDEVYFIRVEGLQADGTTWAPLTPAMGFGNGALLGGAADDAATGNVVIGFYNPYAGNVRVATYVTGTIATGMNFKVDALPLVRFPA